MNGACNIVIVAFSSWITCPHRCFPISPRRSTISRAIRACRSKMRSMNGRAKMAGVLITHEQRIHIIGGPGSGKTTLARRLSARLSVPAYDLDTIAYESGAGRKRPLDMRLTDVRRIAADPAWVIEGAYLWWTDDVL